MIKNYFRFVLLVVGSIVLSVAARAAWNTSPPKFANAGDSATVSASVSIPAGTQPYTIAVYVQIPAGTWVQVVTGGGIGGSSGATITAGGSYFFNQGGGNYIWKAVYGTGGTRTANDTIVAGADPTTTTVRTPITAATISALTYNGGAQSPGSVNSVSPAGATVVVSASPQTEVGTYNTATVSGSENYTGTLSGLSWTITPAGQSVGINASSTTVDQGNSVTFTASGGGGGGYNWGGSASGNGSTTIVTFPNAGSYNVTLISPGDGNHYASNTAVVTITVNDKTAPTIPTGVGSTAVTPSSFTLNWTASSDNVGVTGYRIYDNGVTVAGSPTTGTSLAISGMSQGTRHPMNVAAVDAAGNLSGASSTLIVWTTDTQPPTPPTTLSSSSVTATGFTLSWSGAGDNVGIAGYHIYNNGVEVAGSPTSATSLPIAGLTQGTNYPMTVKAYDATNLLSSASSVLNVQTTDTQAPTPPTTLTASSITATSFTLNWSGATDNIGISAYRIYNNGVEVGGSPTTGTSLSITGLTQGTNYPMTVKAYDAASNLSTASSVLNVQTTDTQSPTPPTTLTPSSITATSFTLGWSGASDNVGVSGYHIYSNGVEVAGSPTAATSLAITGLTQGTNYPMTVKAYDVAGNSSTLSSTLNVRTSDTQAPSIPSGLGSAGVTATGFTLNWSVSSDNVGVSGYHVYANGVEVGGSPTAATSLAITGLTQGTSYPMTVKAYDAAGNTSAASSTLNVRTIDTQAPSIPTGLASSAKTVSGFTLSWTASTDNVAVSGYHVYNAGVEVTGSPTTATTLAISGLNPNTAYAMTVKAYDAASNASAASSPLSVTTLADTTAPSVPTGLANNTITTTAFNLSWTASTDNVAVSGYHVYRAGVEVTGSPTTATTLAVTGLNPNTTYAMTVKAYDAASNLSAASTALNVTTASDSVAPTTPTGLASSSITATGFTLTWTASTDNVGVSGYHIYKAGVEVTGSPTAATTLVVTGLTPNTANAMTVKAYDAANNLSAAAALSVTTLNDTVAPSVPTGLGSSAVTINSFTLSWSASTDNVGVAGYHIYKAGVEVSGSPTASLSKAITGLVPNTTYAMTVKSYDAAGNISASSTALNVQTSADSSAPSVPTGLTSAAIQNTSFTLSWTASTDNIGVVGYHIYKAGVEVTGSPTSATSLSITGLLPNTAYAMTVKAYDAIPNVSAASAPLTVTTANSSTADSDGDGTPDAIETQLGTNPNSAAQSDSGNSTQLDISKPQ